MPSFKVTKQLNVWYDHGTGKGGNLVDVGTLNFNCSVADLLQHLSQNPSAQTFSFHPPTSWDISGTVASPNSSLFKAGDDVFGMANFPGIGNAYTEYVAVPGTHLALKPSNIEATQDFKMTMEKVLPSRRRYTDEYVADKIKRNGGFKRCHHFFLSTIQITPMDAVPYH